MRQMMEEQMKMKMKTEKKKKRKNEEEEYKREKGGRRLRRSLEAPWIASCFSSLRFG